MSPQTIKILITAILLLHGIAHGRAFLMLIPQAAGNERTTPLPVRSWLIPSLGARTAGMLAIPFWLLPTIGFVLAALSFWGTFEFGSAWRQLAIASAIVSTGGMALFSGIWPGAPDRRLSNLDTIIALVVNLAVFVVLLWLQWPPVAMFGK